jgi:cytochrome c peroxidase
MKNYFIKITFYTIILSLLICCKKKENIRPVFSPTPYSLEIPSNFPPIEIDSKNPLTEEGVLLGRHLFWEKRLSGDNTMSCATCHNPQNAFSDSRQYSTGINGHVGKRNSMVLQNLAWSNDFFWDGSVISLEEQILLPVMDSTEMNETWANALSELKYDPSYNTMFFEAFGLKNPDSTHAAKAIAQFLTTMISSNSKFDKVLRNEASFTPEENAGYASFNSFNGGDCFHCHGGILGTDLSYKNNGLDENPIDSARGLITGNELDNFKFKVPSIRNLEFSSPYMHDGRFTSLDQVINFYSIDVHANSPNIDPLIEFASQGGVQLDPQERQELKAFLLTLSDPDFINNPNYSNPF